jgi:hypothetical protein
VVARQVHYLDRDKVISIKGWYFTIETVVAEIKNLEASERGKESNW